MSPRLTEFFRRPWRGLAAITLLAFAPKCIVCLAVYAGLGTVLGLGGPELCGAPADPSHAPVLIAAAIPLTISITCVAVRKHVHR
jgi:hypothetical protein